MWFQRSITTNISFSTSQKKMTEGHIRSLSCLSFLFKTNLIKTIEFNMTLNVIEEQKSHKVTIISKKDVF